MRRGLLVVVLLLAAGCVAPSAENQYPEVDDAGVCVSPGETGDVRLHLHDVDHVGVRPHDGEALDADYENTTWSEGWDRMLLSFPPQYVWDRPMRALGVSVPVEVSSDADPGTYTLGVSGNARHNVSVTVGECD